MKQILPHHEEMKWSSADAVELLSRIADLDFDVEISAEEQHDLLLANIPMKYRTLHWFHRLDFHYTLNLVREIFKTLLNSLHAFYRNEEVVDSGERIESVKAVMVLIGEAAKKLDRFNSQLPEGQREGSIKDSPEYEAFQELYLSHLSQKIHQGELSRWILGLTKGKEFFSPAVHERFFRTKEARNEVEDSWRLQASNRFTADFESIKKDIGYELFLMHRADGRPFLSARLLRNVKLVCDFGETLHADIAEEPLPELQEWRDQAMGRYLASVKQFVEPYIRGFWKRGRLYWDSDLVGAVSKALIALCRGAILRSPSSKAHYSYFSDLLVFLGDALRNGNYQKMVTYARRREAKGACELFLLLRALCQAIYCSHPAPYSLLQSVRTLLEIVPEPELVRFEKLYPPLCRGLAMRHHALTKALQKHRGGPLTRLLELLDQHKHGYDPLAQGNYPAVLCSLVGRQAKTAILHLPSPTEQMTTEEAGIRDEFRGALLTAADRQNGSFLLVNLQDRTSWKEHGRAAALESLQDSSELSNVLAVASLAKAGEFYNQTGSYQNESESLAFLDHFKQHIGEPVSGFWMPANQPIASWKEFIDGCLSAIHKLFFRGAATLEQGERRAFIEIFYLFFSLKLIELYSPKWCAFVSKDGLDSSAGATLLVYFFCVLMNHHGQLAAADQGIVDLLLYALPLMQRERLVDPECFWRFFHAFKQMEMVHHQLGHESFVKAVEEHFSQFFPENPTFWSVWPAGSTTS